ncbi:MAG TPA: DNA polymerase III subunit beta [Saprospiraceae bacterium]|nr:DNA polymerase III subunit beta [Saprospiraceae bacterium]
MKFNVSSSALLKHLQITGGAIASNPVIPILEDFLFKLKGNALEITASTIDVTIQSKMEVNGSVNGSIAIPGKTLLETLKSMPEQPLEFVVDLELRGIEITSTSGKYKLVGERAEDYPEVTQASDEEKLVFDSQKIVRAIDKTIFATSNDEMRQHMKGVCMNIDFNHLTFVATDAHKLVKYSFLDIQSNVASSIILPKKALLALKAILPREGSVNIFYGKTKAYFEFDNTILSCRLIEGKFPDYNAVIPVNNPNLLKVNRPELLSALRRLAIFANKTTNQVVFNIQDKSLTISASDLDLNNEATEQLICDYTGEPMSIGLNAKFLVEMLSALEHEELQFELSANNKPAIIVPSEQDPGENILMLVVTNY